MSLHAPRPSRAPAGPDLESRRARTALAGQVTKLFDLWALQLPEQAALLGLSPESHSTLARYRKGEPLAPSRDLLERAGHLLAIHKSLRIMFPNNRDLAYRWVTTPNRRFGGKRPMDVMQESGFLGIVMVRRYLDFERGR